jgi:hypothetical protein
VALDWDDGFEGPWVSRWASDVVECESDAQQRGELRDGFGELVPGRSNRLQHGVDLKG